MPGQWRKPQTELLRHHVHDLQAPIAERRERADGAAELHRELVVVQPDQLCPGRVQSCEPLGRLEPEADRSSLLQERAPGHDGRAVVVRELRARSAGHSEIGQQRSQRALDDQHRGGVDHVLARRTLMEIGGCRPGRIEAPAHRGEQGRDGRAATGRTAAEGRQVEPARIGSQPGQLLGCGFRRQPDTDQPPHQRQLDVEHGLRERPVADERRDRTTGEQSGKDFLRLGGHRDWRT